MSHGAITSKPCPSYFRIHRHCAAASTNHVHICKKVHVHTMFALAAPLHSQNPADGGGGRADELLPMLVWFLVWLLEGVAHHTKASQLQPPSQGGLVRCPLTNASGCMVVWSLVRLQEGAAAPGRCAHSDQRQAGEGVCRAGCVRVEAQCRSNRWPSSFLLAARVLAACASHEVDARL